jgi:hypothetical protein
MGDLANNRGRREVDLANARSSIPDKDFGNFPAAASVCAQVFGGAFRQHF